MNTKYFKNRKEWHEWLLENSKKADEVWLIYYKKKTGKESIAYEDAVLEALSFGWIDSTVNRIDEERYMQRFTPRRKGSVWSEVNLKRVKRLIKEGRMTQTGLDAAKNVLFGKTKAEPGTISDKIKIPADFEKELTKDKTAKDNFKKFPRSTKKMFYWSIESAKKPETRARRLAKAIKAARENNKFGYM